MHVISNERALAHWQALIGLPDFAAEWLRDRFGREQPHLSATLLMLTGGTYEDADGKLIVRPENDPALEHFRRISLTAAVVAEVMRREAKRPLRSVEAAEASALIAGNLELFKKFKEPGETPAGTTPELFASCAQPDLFRGVFVAITDDPRLPVKTLTLDCYLLRLVIEGLHAACGDAASTETAWDAERILVALSAQGDPLRREALAVGDAFRAELAPHLIAEIQYWGEEPMTSLEEDVSLGMHGLFLLAKWRKESAWPVFRKLFLLPGDVGYDLLGDLITEEGPVLLAMVGGSRREELRAMIEDESLDEFCRCACLDALTCLVAWGELPRAEQIIYLRELLAGKLRGVPANEHVLAGVVSAACDLEAWELRPDIEASYERGLVDDGYIDLPYFIEAAAGKHPSPWPAFCERHQPITDVAAATKWLDELPLPLPPLPSLDEVMDVNSDWPQPYVAPAKVGRNDPCPCGSGKKFKKCCGG